MKAGNFVLLCMAGWINRDQQAVIEYLQEDIWIPKQLHGGRLCFNDRQRRRLAAKARKLGFGRSN